MTKSKGVRTKPPGNSVPTYIRFTRSQLRKLDRAVKEGHFLNRSEAARVAVDQAFVTTKKRCTEKNRELQDGHRNAE